MDNTEDATELKFPKEFETAKPLLNSEVFLLLQTHKDQNEYGCTLHWSTLAMRSTLESRVLHQFEVASLANHLPESAEEAKSLESFRDSYKQLFLKRSKCWLVTFSSWNKPF